MKQDGLIDGVQLGQRIEVNGASDRNNGVYYVTSDMQPSGLNFKEAVDTFDALPNDPEEGDAHYITELEEIWAWSDKEWVQINSKESERGSDRWFEETLQGMAKEEGWNAEK